MKFTQIFLKFFIILSMVLSLQTLEQTQTNEAYAGNDSYEEFKNEFQIHGLGDFLSLVKKLTLDCMWQDVIKPWQFGLLNQNCIPRLITQDSATADCDNINIDNNPANGTITALIVKLTIIAALSIAFAPIMIPVLIIGYVGVSIEACLTTFVIAPHEYINKQLTGNYLGGTYNGKPFKLEQVDVPFFYNCLDHPIPSNVTTDDLNTEYGNLTGSSELCSGSKIMGGQQYALNNLASNPLNVKPGAIIVGSYSLWHTILHGISGKPDISVYNISDIRNPSGNSSMGNFIGGIIPFYRFDSGKVQLCAAKNTMVLPVIMGCTYIAPPIEIHISSGFGEDTRCSYFLNQRDDLHWLGNQILNGATGNESISVGLFLQSDMHIMSTVVGCIKDLLLKVVIGTTTTDGKPDENSFLFLIQKGFRSLVMVILVLYVSILGIKIMSSPQPPQTGEVVMYIVKFAFVIMMTGITGTSIWFSWGGDNSSSTGLYNLMLDSMEELADDVLQATTSLAPVDMCYFPASNVPGTSGSSDSASDVPTNILSMQNVLSTNPTKTPNNTQYVKLSVWDFIDCKLMNFLSLNSCKYGLSGMVSGWIVIVSIWMPSLWLLGIVTLMYGIMMFLTMTRFIHLTVVSMFALTILVLISPIFFCFLLFEYTKESFQTWFKTLLGYILYPAFIFTLVALMIATYDNIFYGPPPTTCGGITGVSCKIADICTTDNSSLYCAIAKAVYKGNYTDSDASFCNSTHGQLFDAFIGHHKWKVGGVTILRYQVLKDGVFDVLWPAMVKMFLFAVLFFFLTDSVLQFIETLLRLQGISAQAPKTGIASIAKKSASMAIMPFKAAYKGGKGAYDKIKR